MVFIDFHKMCCLIQRPYSQPIGFQQKKKKQSRNCVKLKMQHKKINQFPMVHNKE